MDGWMDKERERAFVLEMNNNNIIWGASVPFHPAKNVADVIKLNKKYN